MTETIISVKEPTILNCFGMTPVELCVGSRVDNHKHAALALAGLGWRIVPLIPGEKRPYIKTGKEHSDAATTDPVVLDGWWEEFPDAAIGVVTGPISGLDRKSTRL